MTINSPPQCKNSTMSAYPGSSGKEIVLLDAGNYAGQSSYLNETWTFTGTTANWTDQSSTAFNANGPLPGRNNACMSYDGTNVTLFGGQGGSSTTGVLEDTWTWNGSVWTQLTGPGLALVGPFGRYNMEAAFLNGAGAAAGLLMFGGENLLYPLLETWFWSGSAQTWTQISVANGTGPAARIGHVMAGSSASPGTVVMFGGQGTNSQFNDTWSYTAAGGWSLVTPTSGSPSVRSNACMAYDIANARWVMFGGQNEYNYLNETWAFTLTSATSGTWTQISEGNGVGPSGRIDAMMAYDATTLAAPIMFGGQTATAGYAINETWSLTGSTWTQL
jgi:hypothetical protein